MRALITGVAGQDGTLLSELLLSEGWEVYGTRMPGEQLPESHALDLAQVLDLEITDFDEVLKVIDSIKPDVVFHLAGISSVAFSIQNPELTNQVNVGGTKNLIEAISQSSDLDVHLIHAASTEIFAESEAPLTESSSLGPRSPYAESKAQAVGLIQQARESGIRATNAILANHESYLRTTDFVTGKIAHEVARISLGIVDHIQLGNLDVEKNWSSARDIVAGMLALAEKRYVGDIILANSESTKLTTLLEAAFSCIGLSDWHSYVRTDEELVRSKEARVIRIDPGLAKRELNWQASTPLETWINEMVQFHTQQISNQI